MAHPVEWLLSRQEAPWSEVHIQDPITRGLWHMYGISAFGGRRARVKGHPQIQRVPLRKEEEEEEEEQTEDEETSARGGKGESSILRWELESLYSSRGADFHLSGSTG